MEQNADKEKRLINLANKIIEYSRDNLSVELRFLSNALYSFDCQPYKTESYMTDDGKLFFNPKYIIKRHKESKNCFTRDYLHSVLHCIFRHTALSDRHNRKYWDIACDIAVENVISELGLNSADDKKDCDRIEALNGLFMGLSDTITADLLYKRLKDYELDESELELIRQAYSSDSHELWYLSDEEKALRYGIKSDKNKDKRNWERQAAQVSNELEYFGKNPALESGNLVRNLDAAKREKHNYASFLKRFAETGEVIKLNHEEFDYIYYTYGMQINENTPLIEPLEYAEEKRIRDFVIAVDTSGSTIGSLVKAFITKSYNIIKSTESFFSKVNIHIIQCDSEIKEHIRISSQEEFEEYVQSIQIKGGGGTDFRPVFEEVNRLMEAGEFDNLKGLIYFTDGYGVFPDYKPSYETAFAFIDDGVNNLNTPAWAIKLIIDDEDIRTGEANEY